MNLFSAAARVGRFWKPERVERTPEAFWMADEQVRRYINECVTGRPDCWPLEWFAEQRQEPFSRALVPGCGSGELERDLLAKGLCRQVHAFDVSAAQVEAARLEAQADGLGERIHYSVSSFEGFEARPGHYDACFFHAALHHFAHPERVLQRLSGWLRPGATVYLDEYVGPSRKQWSARTFAAARLVYDLLPAADRKGDRLEIPGLLAKLADPSESIASDEILPAFEQVFAPEVRRDYHGFILQPIWIQIRPEPPLVARLIAIERALASVHPTWFTVLVGRKSR